ncbi:transcriptional regulator, GntR family protein [Oceanicola granulosus HTCC2516]|uniref:Transcriptional regulator, GntR family protein n=1 Tax=Oceanicola granulosus (strain ATCC BAA-861 / DSM 15982 / KCTC 12143 / HTCC2516) TaxID=314256 RepID=Q2CIA3_OCEGH|nr:UTRA domain-containing protein [Oceanicola granulosus]EAR52355.1 transcriptional regulator, GntR family protein [Oceanicola granulosus HTCC2516]
MTTFRQIKSDVIGRITAGEWGPDATLPSETELAARYGCARATVNRALRELADDGVLERRRKSGTRVRAAPVRQARFEIPLVRREVEGQGAAYRYALVERAVMAAPDWLRARMALEPEARVLHLVCMHYANASPYQYEDRWIALDTLPAAEAEDFAATAPTAWLLATIPFSQVEISFAATEADAALAAHLGCAEGAALFFAERSTWFDGKPVTFVRLVHRPGHRVTARY